MSQKSRLILISLFTLLSLVTFGQKGDGKVKGTVAIQQKGVEAASVSVLQAKDSSLIQIVVTDKTGEYAIENLANGSYLIMVSFASYKKAYGPVFEISNSNKSVQAPPILLATQISELRGVTVIAKKPFIEQKLDRTIVNVDAVATNTGISVLEVLEKTPGIMVDKDGNISLKGKQGVMILIDGKPSYLGGQDLANLLKSMPSSQLEQLEIMTNPPAKYDAAGNAGIINLKTKKSKARGFNGSATLGAGFGYYPRSNTSLSLNYRINKWNVFGNYGYNRNKGFRDILLTRKFMDAGTNQLASLFDQTTHSVRQSQFHSLKIGADFYASKNTTIGIVVNGFISPNKSLDRNTTLIEDSMNLLQTKNLANSHTASRWKNGSVNVNLRHQFDSTGTELTADLDYTGYNSFNDQYFDNFFYDKDNNKKQPDEFVQNHLPSNINIYSAKADFTMPINKTTKFEAGVKSSYVETDNNALFQNLVNDQWVTDAGRTNHFIYKENINAAYVNGNKEFSKKWSVQLGLRLENTNAKGSQLTTGQSFDRKYTQLFPTAYVGYNVNDQHQLVLNYGRRIQRPDYENLNPFYNFLDKYTYQVGNPYLRPQFTHNIELAHTYNSVLTTTVNYSATNDIISDVLDQIDSTNTTFITKSNIAKQKNIGLSVNFGKPLTKWYRVNIYGNGYYNKYSGIIRKEYFTTAATSYMFNITNQFTFSKGWSAEIGGFYRSKAIQGTMVSNPMKVINFGFGKQLFKNQGSLRVNISDPFNMRAFSGYSKYQNIDLVIRNRQNNRMINISFTYRFGKPIKGIKQRKSGGAADEQSRVGAGGN